MNHPLYDALAQRVFTDKIEGERAARKRRERRYFAIPVLTLGVALLVLVLASSADAKKRPAKINCWFEVNIEFYIVDELDPSKDQVLFYESKYDCTIKTKIARAGLRAVTK